MVPSLALMYTVLATIFSSSIAVGQEWRERKRRITKGQKSKIYTVETPKCLHSQYTVQVFLCNKKKMN